MKIEFLEAAEIELDEAFKQLELVYQAQERTGSANGYAITRRSAHPLRKSIVRCIIHYCSSQTGAWELERLPTK